MNAAVAAWLAEQCAHGAARVELWELVTPQRRAGAYDLGGAAGVDTLADAIAAHAREPAIKRRIGHALFAYASDRVEEQAIGLALLRRGALVVADFDAASIERRMLAALLRESEIVARHMRLLQEVRPRAGMLRRARGR